MLDLAKIREDFPILNRKIYGKPLVYLDNAATTHKPQVVQNDVVRFYSNSNSNIHRGVHFLSEEAANEYERARETVQHFLNAEKAEEVVFTRNTTDSINVVADSFGRGILQPKDEILITEMEHHSNLVPWQMLCKRTGAFLKVIPFDNQGQLQMEVLDTLLTDKTKLLAVTYVSNVLGVINPVKDIIRKAHAREIPVLVDAAQAIQHLPVDVRDLDCDFLVFSGHKIYADNGIGVLYGKEKWLGKMPPCRFGGGMIHSVTMQETNFGELPFKFEAGTPNIAGAVSLASALNFVTQLGFAEITLHEKKLLDAATNKIAALENTVVYAQKAERCAAVSFNIKQVSAYDIGVLLDKIGIAVRTGKHCADPVMQHYGINGTIRASFALYNTLEEVDKLLQGIEKAMHVLK